MLKGFRVGVYGFKLEALTPIYLPPYKGGVLRGAFGSTLKRISCALRSGECSACVLRSSCPYGVIFESGPGPGAERLRTFDQVPRPFVLRPTADERTVVLPGEDLAFELVLVGRAIEYLPYFVVVFRELGDEGLGLRKEGRGGRAFLRSVVGTNPITGCEEEVFEFSTNRMRSIDLSVKGEVLQSWALGHLPEKSLGLEFVTMTRLQHGARVVDKPEFHVLVRALLRRLSTLAYFYHGIEIDLDFRGLISRSEGVVAEPGDLRWEDWRRFSSRQKASMDFGGLVGKVSYQGDLKEFLPLLAFGWLVHVGKNATFGLGRYRFFT